MVDVQAAYPRFQGAGGEVALVTMGSSEQTAQFREAAGSRLLVLADANQEAYRAYGLRRGTWWEVIGPRVWPKLLKATVRAGAGKPVGDVRQMPGTFVIDREGIVRYVHDPANQAQRPSNDELVAALESLACDRDRA